MPLIFACISPHPPIIIPSIGKESLKYVTKTVSALKALNNNFVRQNPETILIISPHAPLLPNAFSINVALSLSGDFKNFGDEKTYLQFENDLNLVEKIFLECKKEKISICKIENKNLDHGCLVPLYYLTSSNLKVKLVVLSFSFLELNTHFLFGQIIQKVIQKFPKRVAVVASGDLSHRLTFDAPAGFHPDGKKFDKKLVELLKRNKIKEILNLNQEFIENAGECGLRSITILLGILSKLKYTTEILSYEGPFGVGYLVANFQLKLSN